MSSFARCFASDSCSAYKNHSATDIKSKWLKSGCKRGKKQKRIWNKYNTPPACKASSSAACLRAMASASPFESTPPFQQPEPGTGHTNHTKQIQKLKPFETSVLSKHLSVAHTGKTRPRLWSESIFGLTTDFVLRTSAAFC